MQLREFFYELPEELIAQYPPAERGLSRLLYLDKQGNYTDHRFADLPDFLKAGDLLVFNDTRVIPARLFGRKETGGRVEILLERLLDPASFKAQIRASKSPKLNSNILVGEEFQLQVRGREGDMYLLGLAGDKDVMQLLEQHGHMPLPPYIQRSDEILDSERYQTVYGKKPGAVAAPTAGLHFTEPMLQGLRAKGVDQAYVTLHVAAGTFQPVRVERIEEHVMHSEYIDVPREVCDKILQAKARGGRVIAVGTTSLRCLETASLTGTLQPYQGETDIFIYPGFEFHTVDCLITNFHLPESTLLMLVSAFAGKEPIMRAYGHAIEQRYRFFSYGDAMFIERAGETL